MSEAELDEIRAAAERHRTSVSEWVRSVLREERERARTGRHRLLRETPTAYAGAERAAEGKIRIELDVDEDVLEAVRARYRLSSPRAAVEYALRRAAITPMSKDEALAMQGVGWEADLEAMRSDDSRGTW